LEASVPTLASEGVVPPSVAAAAPESFSSVTMRVVLEHANEKDTSETATIDRGERDSFTGAPRSDAGCVFGSYALPPLQGAFN
jgi:hypothetical protein